MRGIISSLVARSYRFARRCCHSGSLFVINPHQLRSLVALCFYFAASPLLCICNKILFSGAAAGLPLCCCALQQFTCCCLLVGVKLVSGWKWKESGRKGLNRFASWHLVPVSIHLINGNGVSKAFEVLTAAACFVSMLVATNRCLSAASISAYQIARCSSIPTALLLEVLGVLPAAHTPPNDSRNVPHDTNLSEAGCVGEYRPQKVSIYTTITKSPAAICAVFSRVTAVVSIEMEKRRQRIRPIRFAAAAVTAAGMAAAVADGHTLQLHAAGWGVCASLAGCIYMQLLRKRLLQGGLLACEEEPSTTGNTLEANAASRSEMSQCQRHYALLRGPRLTPQPKATTKYAHSEVPPLHGHGGGRGERGKYMADFGEEVSATMKTTGVAAFLLIPLVLASGELTVLRSRLNTFRWLPLDRPIMAAASAGEISSALVLLLLSGILAACLSVCTHTSLRGLSPVACCITGFCRTALQLLLSPLLQKETLSPGAVAGCCCCLVGAMAFCLDSIANEKGRRQSQVQG